MNFALFDSPGVLAPLHGLINWFSPTPLPENRTKAEPVLSQKTEGIQIARASQRPLRIVRILDSDHTPTHVGRMVISGRMSDVCAELDRLAAREAALH